MSGDQFLALCIFSGVFPEDLELDCEDSSLFRFFSPFSEFAEEVRLCIPFPLGRLPAERTMDPLGDVSGCPIFLFTITGNFTAELDLSLIDFPEIPNSITTVAKLEF